MKTRRWLTWLVFAICALAVVEGLGWVTWQALRLERSEREARAQAEFQESIRLALWRMESEVTPIIAKEAARPYFHYQSFYPAERAFTRMWQAVQPGDVLVPSPLLEPAGEFIRLHYQVGPDGTVTSPQAPTGTMRELAESQNIEPEFIVLAEQRLAELAPMVREPGPLAAAKRLAADDRQESPQAAAQPPLPAAQPQPLAQQVLSDKEYAARQQAAQTANASPEQRMSKLQAPAGRSAPESSGRRIALNEPSSTSRDEQDRAVMLSERSGRPDSPAPTIAAAAPQVDQGPLEPIWRTNPATGTPELLVQRTVRFQGATLEQGFWIDWPALRARLIATTADLLPRAGLIPLTGERAEAAPGALRLATIPVMLSPGVAPEAASTGFSATHGTLALTWAAIAAAILAIAIVLRASMDLSDRRGRFVSAVTHELRTPLTTFCMYTEMLAGGMVREEPAQREYLATLRTESSRLAGIVENVLDYARLGGAARAHGQPRIAAPDLIAQALPTLRRRAEAGGMTLDVRIEGADGRFLAADPRTLERILLNLMDNACKYAAAAPDRRIHLSVGASDRGGVQVRIRDHGPGVPRADHRRVFRPFHRAKRDAEGPQAGLGLGLALSRGLARSLGGDLRLERDSESGAEFVLTLPGASDPIAG